MKRFIRMAFAALLLLPGQAFAYPKVQEVVSAGGVTAWLIEERGLPLVSVRAVFTRAGSASDPAGKEGRAAMVSDLLAEGAGGRDALAFSTALEERAIRMNFIYDEDLMVTSVETLSEHKNVSFSLLSDALARPRFDADAIERIRAQSLTALKQLEQSPGWLAGMAWNKAAYGTHPYGQPANGTEKSLKKLARNDMETYRERHLTRENLIVAVAGDITAKELAPLLDSAFGGLPEKFSPEREIPEAAFPEQGKTIVLEKDIPQSVVIFGGPGLKRADAQYFDGMVLNYIVGGGDLNSRLASEVREKKGLAYSINTQLDPMLAGAAWKGNFSTRAEQVHESVRTVLATIAGAYGGDITDEEVADAKKYIAGSFMLSLDTNAELAAFLISMQPNTLGTDYLEKRNALVEAVTPQSVQAVAKRLLDGKRFIIARIGNKEAEGAHDGK